MSADIGRKGPTGRGCWMYVLLFLPTLLALAAVAGSGTHSSDVTTACPRDCVCSGSSDAVRVDCSNQNITSVPTDIRPMTAVLDLSWNLLTKLPERAFADLRRLQELNLASNLLESIHKSAFLKLTALRTLYLQNNKFLTLPTDALKPLVNLEIIHLSHNLLTTLDEESLLPVSRLQKLWLDGNNLTDIPTSALSTLTRLEALNMASNKIQRIPDFAFQNLKKLVILVLQRNVIDFVAPKAFEGLVSLKVLEINDNKLEELPEAISSLPLLRELSFADNEIRYLGEMCFQANPQLAMIELSGNPIMSTAKSTFSNLPFLQKLTLSEARQLEEFPNMSGTSSLEHLRLDRAKLSSVPFNFCNLVPLLKSLNLKSNQLTDIPVLDGCTELRLLDLSYNLISSLGEVPFKSQKKLIDLFLGNNAITRIDHNDFLGLESLQVLDLESNDIHEIHPEAFVHFKDLRDLNLGANIFPSLPTKGLQNIRQLKTFNNRQLKEFPPPHTFPRVHTLALSYAYHCCAFLPLLHRTPSRPASLQETIVWLAKEDVDMASWSANITDVWPGYENFSNKFEEFANQLWKAFGRDYAIPDNLAQYAEEYFEDYKSSYSNEESLIAKFSIQCLPEPGPFMPCEDLFGWWSLRCGVWVVFLLALLGNGVVVIVLLVGRSKMDVPRFLVCNLAAADFFMGVYLGILAVVDASTLGEFKVFAIKWQTSAGCQVAGFLGVLSSELSVYTLSVITLERNYAITHAMHLNKRLSLRHAGYIMLAGWCFALVMAILPLFGVSDYRKFAICLPFETEDPLSLGYVVFLILINGVAFLILMGCYLKMYCAIRGSQAWNSNDSRIARRMALLVFTDFICWAPIAFFSLTAVFGLQLISLEEAKVFTIFVLPLNSCANPFLYAIFTKQFKKDCIHICKRIEESRVTRGIGRGRHSSNFSNRHTPVNTNSATEQKSGSDQVVCQCRSWKAQSEPQRDWKAWARRYLLCRKHRPGEEDTGGYTYAIAQIQRNVERRHKHTSSISSENFSSRSDSWRQGNIPLRLLDQGARRGSWTLQRKASQDSNMSCSRQDSSTSTFRMSRSSFSSDSSNQTRTPYSRASASLPTNGDAHSRASADKAGASNETSQPRLLRAMISKEKPKLCRQGAVADECISTRPGTRGEPRSYPQGGSKSDRLCAVCARKEASPPLVFKSKELEEKFTCFYNRLAESSHEDSSEVSTSKEEQVILSSEQSTGDNRRFSIKEDTNDTYLTDTRDTTDVVRPHIEVNPMSDNINEELFICRGEIQCSSNSSVSRMGQRLQQSSCESIDDNHHLHVTNIDHDEEKCKSLTNIDKQNAFDSGRKSSSDNSLTKITLKNLPTIFRSFSSQITNSKDAKSKLKSQMHLGHNSMRSIPASKSENLMHKVFEENLFKASRPRFEKNDSDIEDTCHRSIPEESFKNKNPEQLKLLAMAASPKLAVKRNEKFPLIDEDG